MGQAVLSQADVEILIARGGIPSDEEFDALFARWHTMVPEIRDAEQTRLSNSLSAEGNAAWDRRCWRDHYAGMQDIADEALRALNGNNVPLVDGSGRAIDFWRFWKESWVEKAANDPKLGSNRSL